MEECCALCNIELTEEVDFIGLYFEKSEALVCTFCVEAMTDVVEHYWMHKEMEEEEVRH